jgi:hypothetical protein
MLDMTDRPAYFVLTMMNIVQNSRVSIDEFFLLFNGDFLGGEL